MAQKVLTWSNSQLNPRVYVPCFLSSCTCIQSKFTSGVKDVAFVLIYI